MIGPRVPRETDVWLTPPHILAAVGGWESFDLDPCAPMTRPWPMARRHFTRADNGLIRPWSGRVWLNPPYGDGIGRWLARMAEHNCGLAFVFSRTDTGAFFRFIWNVATAVFFIRGRVTFLDEAGRPFIRNGRVKAAPAPSVLVAYGDRDARVLGDCGLDGAFVPLRIPRLAAVAISLETWREVVSDALAGRRRGSVSLAELYRALARHPKTRRNSNWQAKVRQVLQKGPFERVGRGEWKLASEVAA